MHNDGQGKGRSFEQASLVLEMKALPNRMEPRRSSSFPRRSMALRNLVLLDKILPGDESIDERRKYGKKLLSKRRLAADRSS